MSATCGTSTRLAYAFRAAPTQVVGVSRPHTISRKATAMTSPARIHFSRPMRSLRRAAWVIAAKGNPVAWNDPTPEVAR